MPPRVAGQRDKKTTETIGDETRDVVRDAEVETLDDLIEVDFDTTVDRPDPEQLGPYQIVGRLGKGAMGVVYEALDPRFSGPLAIKLVTRLSPEGLYRFKREFRSLAQFQHPNVVSLYELHLLSHRLFFTMELIRGVDLITWLCGPELESAGAKTRPCVDYNRLLDALRQLGEGVHAIHRAGILHRDIKPSNVMVADTGRVVLLDFGLVRQHDDDTDLGVTDDGAVLGTPLYMSPEQTTGDRLGPATDWYGVGELLYQALTGQPPFQGKGMLALLASKQEGQTRRPSEFVADIPPKLEALCMDLLEREPERRPRGEDVLQRIATIGAEGSWAPKPIERSGADYVAPREILFSGRELERESLYQALGALSQGRPVVALVDGVSGMGKTALVQQFLHEVSSMPNTVVLSGTCSERESIPYKALDSVMDALCVYLRGFDSKADVNARLPRDPRAVARLFPVLLSIPAVANAIDRDSRGLDPSQVRRRAFGALRELWGRIADRSRLVVHIDDLQWTDLDSVVLLDAILSHLDAPPLLLIGAYRSGAERSQGPLGRLVDELREQQRVEIHQIHVGPMSREGATDLAMRMLGEPTKANRALADEVARESEGSPFFIGELVRYARRTSDHAQLPLAEVTTDVSLDSVIRHRLDMLPATARRLLEVIAVAGGRVSQGVALSVAMGESYNRDALARLRSESLVRIRGIRDRDAVEIYHDRIRETTVRAIDRPMLAEIHLCVGRALEQLGDADAVALSHHFRQAGEDQRATGHTIDAAEQAEAALAFDRAAELYRAVLELDALPPSEVPLLEARLAEALANAGRLYDSAQAYLRASGDGRDREHLEWIRRAAEGLLCSGHSEEGRVVLKRVLGAVGLHLPRTTAGAITSMLSHKSVVGVRGLHYVLRDECDVPSLELQRLDACWTASRGLVYTDGLVGADFHARHLRLALRCGEPFRLSRALAVEAHMQAILGADRKLSKALALIEQAQQLAEQADHPAARGFVIECRGHVWMSVGHWSKALADLDEASSTFRNQCTGMGQDLSYCEAHAALCLFFMGQVQELTRRIPVLLRDSQERANPYVEGYARGLLGNVVLLAPDRVDEAEEQLSIYRREAPRRFEAHQLNYVAQSAAMRRYVGDAAGAWELCVGDFAEVKKLSVLAAALAKAEFWLWRGACALAGATVAADPRPGLAIARRNAARLLRHPSVYAQAYGYLTRAGAHALAGQSDHAIRDLRQVIELATSRSMGAHVATAQRRLADLVGGDEAKSLWASSNLYMEREGIVRPDRFTEMTAPGFVRR